MSPSKSLRVPVHPLHRIFDLAVKPTFQAIFSDGKGPTELPGDDTGGAPLLAAGLLANQTFAYLRLEEMPGDPHRAFLRGNLVAGVFVGASLCEPLVVGSLLNHTPFVLRTDCDLARVGQLSVGCDLVIREDDAPLVATRLTEMERLARDLDWYFPLRLPVRLTCHDLADLEIPFEEIPRDDIDAFVDAGMNCPRIERTPLTLLRLAQGLGRWKDVLCLLREHPQEFPTRKFAPLKALACRELGRWRQALDAARHAGFRDGRYPGARWLSPSCLHALIESGDEIEALRLLGHRRDGEPAFYQWLRGLALHRAGDSARATAAFDDYFRAWPGDVIGGGVTQRLTGWGSDE